MSNLVNVKNGKLNLDQLQTLALSKQQCQSLKGGDDGIIVLDVIVH